MNLYRRPWLALEAKKTRKDHFQMSIAKEEGAVLEVFRYVDNVTENSECFTADVRVREEGVSKKTPHIFTLNSTRTV